MIEANKAIVRRYLVDILNSRDIAALDDDIAVDYLDHVAFPGQRPGADGLKQRVATLFQGLDPQWTIHEMVAERNVVAVRWSLSGNHAGAFLGFPPTGRQFTFDGIDIYRISNGKMAEHWNVVDMFGFYEQVALAPGPETTEASPRDHR